MIRRKASAYDRTMETAQWRARVTRLRYPIPLSLAFRSVREAGFYVITSQTRTIPEVLPVM